MSKFTIRYIFFRSEIGSIQTCIQSVFFLLHVLSFVVIVVVVFDDDDDDDDDDGDVLPMMS